MKNLLKSFKRYIVTKVSINEVIIRYSTDKHTHIRVVSAIRPPLTNDMIWRYPISQINDLLKQILNGDRFNGYTFLLWEGYLYETE